MQIIDINGNNITVTDLDKVLEQAHMFKEFKHTESNYHELDKQLNSYWTDIYNKLRLIKTEGKAKKLPTR